MAAFTHEEIDWRCPDVCAILKHAGILSALPPEIGALTTWLQARDYAIHTVDFGLGFAETQRQLGELFRWEEQFGYRLEAASANLNALADGFELQAAPGTRNALLVLRPDTLLDERAWLLGFLSIAAEHSTYHLAVGSRFLTILSITEESPIIGAELDAVRVVPPWPLRLSSGSNRP